MVTAQANEQAKALREALFSGTPSAAEALGSGWAADLSSGGDSDMDHDPATGDQEGPAPTAQ